MSEDPFAPPTHPEYEQGAIVAAFQEHDEAAARRAYALEEGIVQGIRNIRKEWVRLAAQLYEFHSGECWLALGYPSLEQWLATPDVELARSTFFTLTTTYRELVIEQMVPEELLATVDLTKAREIVPAVRRGQVDARTAIADCEALTRTDLLDKYARVPALQKQHVEDEPVRPDDFHYESCPHCGQRMKVYDQ